MGVLDFPIRQFFVLIQLDETDRVTRFEQTYRFVKPPGMSVGEVLREWVTTTSPPEPGPPRSRSGPKRGLH